MMRKAIQIGILVVLGVVSGAISLVAYYCILFEQAATNTFQSINRPCDTDKPCGTLADVNQTLATIRGTFGQVEIAANHENRQLTTLDAQERALFSNLQGTLSDARETLNGARDLTSAASGTLGGVNQTLGATRTALGAIADDGESLKTRLDDPEIDDLLTALRGRVNDPKLDALLRNLGTTTAHVASISGTADQVFTKATKSYLHPSKHRIVRAAHAIEPYAPLTVKTLSCALVPGACL
ncbi:MAG: hypothetical protein ACLGPM_07665 [Acidobacteriota bacterium]